MSRSAHFKLSPKFSQINFHRPSDTLPDLQFLVAYFYQTKKAVVSDGRMGHHVPDGPVLFEDDPALVSDPIMPTPRPGKSTDSRPCPRPLDRMRHR